MNELEMCKAMAKLEGHDNFDFVGGKLCVQKLKGWAPLKEYNPITDLALNCALRDEYEVEIDYKGELATIESDTKGEGLSGHYWVEFSSKDEIKWAVIECILRSKGLWV